MKEVKRIDCIDGIKAIAMILVFNIHFLNVYYCGIYTLNPADFHTRTGVEWWIGATPLNLLYAGKLGARIFLVLSAFLLAYGYFQKPNKRKLVFLPVKKYVRLVVPVVVVNIAVCILMQAGAYYNSRAAVLAGSEAFFGSYNTFAPNLWQTVKEAVFGCFLTGSNSYNGPIWFMQYEFLGCILVAAVLYVIGRRKITTRILVYIILSCLMIRTDYLGMVLGMALADIMCAKETEGILHKIVSKQWLLWLLLLAALYFGTYPSYGNAEGTIYALFPPKVLFYDNVCIPVMLFALFHLKPAGRFFSKKIFKRFTAVSYCFYLVHFPILCTLSSAFFVSMFGKLNYHILVLITYILTFLASVLTAWLMTKVIDVPCCRLADKMEEKMI